MRQCSNKRDPDKLRPIKIIKNYTRYAEGSVLISQGNTRVVCNASVEESVPHHKKDTGEGWVTAEYSMLPRATQIRSGRESKRGRLSGRTQEISRLIGRALRSVCDFKKLGERQIIIDCDVLQADGGTRCASINGGYIALGLACQKLLKRGIIKRYPIKDMVAAISTGIVNGVPFLDLNYEEDFKAEVDMNFVMTGKGLLVEVQGTAEHSPFSFADLAAMRKLAWIGIQDIIAVERRILGARQTNSCCRNQK